MSAFMLESCMLLSSKEQHPCVNVCKYCMLIVRPSISVSNPPRSAQLSWLQFLNPSSNGDGDGRIGKATCVVP
eukprot:530372-Pleurochrysis_carterae.AAC.1